MKKTHLTLLAAAAFASANAVAAPLKDSEAELVSKLFQLSVNSASGGAAHAHEAKADEPLSDAEYKAICRDLGDIGGIELTRNNSRVRIVGEITDANEWALYRRIVARYESLVSDYVVFRPGPKLIESLRGQIASLGFAFAETVSPEKPGVLSLAYDAGVLRISGWFLSDADIASVRAVVEMQNWLSTDAAKADGRVPCELRLKVADRLVDVGVVFVAVNKTASDSFGNLLSDGKILDFRTVAQFTKALSDFVPGTDSSPGTGDGGYVRVSSDINGVLYACSKDGLFATRSSGHTTLDTNDMGKRSKFHKGGKMILKIPGQVSGGDIEQVEYGFTIDCLGKFLRKDELTLDLNLEQSSKPEREADSTDYDQKKIDMTTHVACRLGQTVILAGAHETSENEKGPNGYSFLRKIPILSWIFSGGTDERTDEHFLILVSPTLLASDARLAEKPSAENEKLDDEIKPLLKTNVEEKVGVARWYEIFYFWKWGW